MSDWQPRPAPSKAPSKHHKMPAMLSPQPSNRHANMHTQGYESFASRPFDQSNGQDGQNQIHRSHTQTAGQAHAQAHHPSHLQAHSHSVSQSHLQAHSQGHHPSHLQAHSQPVSQSHLQAHSQGHHPSHLQAHSQSVSQSHLQAHSQAGLQASPQAPNPKFSRTMRGYGTDSDHHVPVSSHSQYQDEFASTIPTEVHAYTDGQTSHHLRGKLTVTAGEQAGHEFFLNREVTHIGRALENDVVLLDIATSRKHFHIRRHKQGFTVLDLASANGLYLNQIRISEEELYDGDELEVGETILLYQSIGFERVREEMSDTDPGIQELPFIPHQKKSAQGASSPSAQRNANQFMLTLNAQDIESNQPKGLMQKASSWVDAFEDWCYHVMNDQGGVAKVTRMVLLLAALAVSLWLGKLLSTSQVDVADIEPQIIQALQKEDFPQAHGIMKEFASRLPTADVNRLQQMISHEQKIVANMQQIQNAIQQSSWTTCIAYTSTFPETHRLYNQVQQFATQCKQSITAIILPQARAALWRGELQVTHDKIKELTQYQTNPNDTKLLVLRYALWVHESLLNARNTPWQLLQLTLREKEALYKAVELKEKGQFKQAIKHLKRAMPSNFTTKQLFNVRILAVQFAQNKSKVLRARRKREHPVDTHSLTYLDGTQMNVYAMLREYEKAIDQSIKARNYPVVAKWIEASLLINAQNEKLIALREKLRKHAQKWYKLGKEAMQEGKSKKALGLMKASLPFLPDPLQQEAIGFIKNL